MTAPPPLEEQAEDFATKMSGLISGTITDNVDFVAIRWDLEETLYVVGNRVSLAPGHDTRAKILTVRGLPIPVPDMKDVFVAADWVFTTSSRGWLKTSSSAFVLKVGDAPVLRLEVDPHKPEGSWLQAHIQVTGESSHIAHLRAMRGLPHKRLQQFHIPVGGFRFRPCLEDFLEFAIDEELINAMDGWKSVLDVTREGYYRTQFDALVQKHPEWATEALAGLDD